MLMEMLRPRSPVPSMSSTRPLLLLAVSAPSRQRLQLRSHSQQTKMPHQLSIMAKQARMVRRLPLLQPPLWVIASLSQDWMPVDRDITTLSQRQILMGISQLPQTMSLLCTADQLSRLLLGSGFSPALPEPESTNIFDKFDNKLVRQVEVHRVHQEVAQRAQPLLEAPLQGTTPTETGTTGGRHFYKSDNSSKSKSTDTRIKSDNAY